MEIKYKNLPLYRIVVNPEEDETGMTCISFVDYPAIETDFMCFKEEKKMAFSVVDGDQHIVTGPAIIRDMPIYRYSPLMGEYYTVFDQNAIDNIILKYSKYGMWNNVSLQHDGNNIEGVTMVEFYKKDSEKGIVPKNFEDVTDGSLFVSYKIEDDALWNEIKNGTDLNGFSIEINADLEPTNEMIDDGMPEDEDDFWDELMALFDELGLEPLFADEKKKFASKGVKGTLEEAVNDGKEVTVYLDEKEIKGFPYTTFKKDGSTNVAMWDNKEWHIVNLKDIKSVQTSNVKATADTWVKAMGSPDYKWVEDTLDESEDVNPVAYKDAITDSIMNGSWVIINYDDEKENPATGARQGVVMELGWTVRGNRAVRFYEQYGDSRHPEDIAGWRTMLVHRIRNIRKADYLEPLTVAPAGFRPLGAGEDRDGFVCDLRSPLR